MTSDIYIYICKTPHAEVLIVSACVERDALFPANARLKNVVNVQLVKT